MKSGRKEKWWKIPKRATYYQPGDGRTVTKAENGRSVKAVGRTVRQILVIGLLLLYTP